jgi:hypothetical protein
MPTSGRVAQQPVTPFTTPAVGDDLDPAIVVAHDNTTAAAHTAHDADATIHIQASLLADRPTAGSAGRFWFASDTKRIYFDTGAAWVEFAYLPTAGGTVADLTVTNDLIVGDDATITGDLAAGASVLNSLDVTTTARHRGDAGFDVDFGPNTTINAANVANVVTFNWDLGNSQYHPIALPANAAIVLTPPTKSNGRVYRGMILDPNGKIISWTTTVRWLGGAPPSTAMTAGKAFVFVIWYLGATPWGQWALEA